MDGDYYEEGVYQAKPYYKHATEAMYLYYYTDRWLVGPYDNEPANRYKSSLTGAALPPEETYEP
ncbi:MAG TPA: hypothetical protein VMW52_11100, partial [Phycisphaerae bacterium]|nr:hypothetical protein [Phycisphaerae bacterium]